MANLSILSGIEFYSYDVEVYDKVLLGTIKYKDSQISKFKKIDKMFFENKSFYGINRGELIKEFIKYLSKYDSKVDKDSFLLNDVVDKRIKKDETYINDTMIFMASPKQYDAQAMAKSKASASQVTTPKEVLKLDMEYKDKIYKVKLDLEALNLGAGTKTLYDFNEKMLKGKVESFLKSYKKDYDIQLSLKDEIVQVGKLLIDVIVYNDHVEGFIDLSHLNLDNLTSIQAQGKDKQDLLNNLIQQLKAHNLTGKLNWGKVTDKTIKKGVKQVANVVDNKTLKTLMKNLTTMVKKVGFNEAELEGRIESIIPNAQPLGVGNLGGDKINISYVLPWQYDKTKIKKKKFAEEYAETAQSNIVIKETPITLYMIDYSEGEITIEMSTDVKWINTFFGSTEDTTYPIIEEIVKIESQGDVESIPAGNLLLSEFVEKIASRPEVKLVTKIDKDTPYPVSFDVDEKGFESITFRFENNATQFRANFKLDGPFSELQSKTYAFYHYLDTIGFDVHQEGIGVTVKGVYDKGDISIVHDIATLLDKIKGFSYKHADSFEAWAKKHKYDYTEAKVFFQIRDIIPNYDGHAIVYKSGKSNFIAIPKDVEGIDGFLSAVKHAYTPEDAGANYRFYFTNLEMMQDFVEFANKIEKPVESDDFEFDDFDDFSVDDSDDDPFGLNEPTSDMIPDEVQDQIDDDFGDSDKKTKEVKNPVFQAFKDKIMTMTGFSPNVMIDKDVTSPVSFQLQLKGFQQFDVDFYENSTQFKITMMPEGMLFTLEPVVKKLINSFSILGVDAKLDGMAVTVIEKFGFGDANIIYRIVKIVEIAKAFAQTNAPQPSAQDLGGVKPNNEPIEPEKEKAVIGKSYLVKKGDVAVNIVPFAKGQFYDVVKVTKGLAGEDDLVDNYRIEVLSVLKSGKIKCKNLTLGYEFKINTDPANVDKTYTLVNGNSEVPKVKEVPKTKEEPKIEEEPVKAPKEEIEPPNREVERTFKASKVKDPEHLEQLKRMKAYVKKIADVVDADNDFALRFLEEPKEFQKYKLPTVGVGLFYYGDKTPTELEQNALYKKVYRGRGLSILRKFFKTKDLNGENCLLVLFVDAQYAKETKAKLIKECLESGNKIRVNGRLYTVKAIYEKKFAIETVAGLMYIDMDSDLIDLTIEGE